MYCTSCGRQMEAADRYCAGCGKPAGEPAAGAPAPGGANRPLMRDMANKKIAGVCSGLARWLDWDVTLIRVGFLAGILFHGLGIVAYLIAWIAMPRDDLRTVTPA